MVDSKMKADAPSARFANFLNQHRWVVRGGTLVPFDIPARTSASPSARQPEGDLELPLVEPTAGPSFATMNRSVLNKSILNKNKSTFNKGSLNKNKALAPAGGGFEEALLPALELRRLHQGTGPLGAPLRRFVWECIDIEAPPGPDRTRFEIEQLLALQNDLQERERRRPDILLEATLDLTAFTRPLSIEGQHGYAATYSLFFTILALCEYVGLIYKDRFGRARPNQFDPRVRPMLPNPGHSSYPSNHAFQCFSIAYAFSSLLPEHPGSAELFNAAQRVAGNREWAGLHYPSDTQAGKHLARRFLPYLVEACADMLGEAREEWI
ncbi:phosphatase PAP2 family protein [Microvirga sesbaniae]|uniref:phosphatase PAP2 family protein n=1 Tax=Microvirga sesbaniae TaxID=681392 RepID=UPI0021C567D7|nr:phosphatase PAP2 family protein [Microvirga sp. HBU67692]